MNSQSDEPVLTTRQAIMEIRQDVKKLLEWRAQQRGALAVVGSGAALAFVTALASFFR